MRFASKHTFQASSPQPVEFQSAPWKERWIHLSESSFKVLQCPFQCVFVSVICVKRRSDGLNECMLWVCIAVLCIHEGLLESWSWHGCLACHLEILWSMQPDSSREKTNSSISVNCWRWVLMKAHTSFAYLSHLNKLSKFWLEPNTIKVSSEGFLEADWQYRLIDS